MVQSVRISWPVVTECDKQQHYHAGARRRNAIQLVNRSPVNETLISGGAETDVAG
jgi:hypothetical protein